MKLQKIRNHKDYQEVLEEYSVALCHLGIDLDDLEAVGEFRNVEYSLMTRVVYLTETYARLYDWRTQHSFYVIHDNTPSGPAMKAHYICSPIKTDDILEFERRVGEVFDIDYAGATETIWPNYDNEWKGEIEIERRRRARERLSKDIREKTREMSYWYHQNFNR